MPGTTKSPSAMMAPGQRCISQPIIDRQLMGFRPRQQHAIAQRMQEPVLADPFLLVDDDPVHDRNLAGWAAEAERGHAQPDPKGFTERDAVAMFGRRSIRSDRGVGHGARSPPD